MITERMFWYPVCMDIVSRLLQRLGLTRTAGTRKYALDAAIQPAFESLAERQQRSLDDLASDLLSEAISRRQLDADLWRRWQSLSPREQQVAALTCLNYTNPQIAARLGVAVETVRTHSRNVQIKFNVRSKSDLRVLLSEWDFSAFEQI
jgi:DNA-binding CsgD family transcriptional regulator